MIKIENLIKIYNQVKVVDIGYLKIGKGEIVGLVGNNGAGKTTMINLVLDLIKANEGIVYSKDQDVSSFENWKNYTGSYIDENFLIGFLTSKEYFNFIASLHNVSKDELSRLLIEFKNFCDEDLLGSNKLIRDLSRGNKNKIGIIASLIGNPEILILDEPFANLDPTSQMWLRNKLISLKKFETTQLISSHDLKHISEICSRILIINKGIIVNDIKANLDTLKELDKYFDIRT
ncbi:MAG: ABC transporter ATP-binding protein [Bacteroidetes bacterium]|nr:ABC transporter ATP-binding protein [Bacteroidota bacterium]MCL6101711.1 ABC transporter ATP-binding protein [Bacteroidota bacterium]